MPRHHLLENSPGPKSGIENKVHPTDTDIFKSLCKVEYAYREYDQIVHKEVAAHCWRTTVLPALLELAEDCMRRAGDQTIGDLIMRDYLVLKKSGVFANR